MVSNFYSNYISLNLNSQSIFFFFKFHCNCVHACYLESYLNLVCFEVQLSKSRNSRLSPRLVADHVGISLCSSSSGSGRSGRSRVSQVWRLRVEVCCFSISRTNCGSEHIIIGKLKKRNSMSVLRVDFKSSKHLYFSDYLLI